jgi:hypothetical protein
VSDDFPQRPRLEASGVLLPAAIEVSILILSAVLFLLAPSAARARDCGDNVAGSRVACACGDTVISDTILTASDPVVQGRCPRGGLVVRANELAETLTLDLHGLSIVGSGAGDGILVRAGGSDGAVVTGGSGEHRAEVVGFSNGIHVPDGRTVRRIEKLELKGQRRHGLLLHTAGTMVLDVRATHNGGDGLYVYGQGGRLLGIDASDNAGAGLRVQTRYTIVRADARRNSESGIVVRGYRDDLSESVANDNKGYGVVLSGSNNKLEHVETTGNSRGGIGSSNGRDHS